MNQLPAWLSIVFIISLSLVLGGLLLRRFAQTIVHESDWPAALFAAFLLGLTIIGWSGLILAELGTFSFIALLVVGVVITAVFSQLFRHLPDKSTPRLTSQPPLQNILPLPNWAEYAMLAVWIIVAGWLFFRPHQFMIGAADAGVYVNLGAEIAQNGSILIQENIISNLDPTLYDAFLRPIENPVADTYMLPAFYVVDAPAGLIMPQFYPLHPVWQAVVYSFGGGIQGELMLSGLWALLGAFAIYLTVRQLAGWQVGMLALGGISLNALQIWFARYPVTEALTQLLFWAGIWSMGMWLSDRKSRALWALLSGLMLGQLFLTRIDMLFMLPTLALFGLWQWASGWKRHYIWFYVPLGGLLIHSVVHALWQSRPYFFDLFGFGFNLARSNSLLVGLLVLLGLAALWLIARFRSQMTVLRQFKRPFLITCMLLFILFAGYLWFVRPNMTPPPSWQDPFSGGAIPFVHHENLIRLGWYLSPLGVWLGVAGIALMIWRVERKTAVLLGITLTFTLLYLWNLRANPHQIYAMRRYVPMVMPLFIVGAAILLGQVAKQRQWWMKSSSLLIAAGWLGWLLLSARGFISQIDLTGIAPQIRQVGEQFTPNAILIFNDQAPIGQGDIIGTPLRFLHGHNVLTMRDLEVLDAAAFAAQLQTWQAAGRTVYWIDVPGGGNWPLADWPLAETGEYVIETAVLEGSYTHKPTAIQPRVWQGTINEVTESNKD